MIVKFENYNREMREIGRCKSQKEAFKIIKDFLDDHNYHAFYYRTWYPEDAKEMCVDVGSWSEFFYIECEEGETLNIESED